MNSTILAWQASNWDALISLITFGLVGFMLILCGMCWRAANNPKNLRKPKYVAWDIFAIPFEAYVEEGVMILVVDVDRTLCRLSLRWWRAEKRLPARSVDHIKRLHEKLGIKVVLATKSNENVHEMIRVQFEEEPWIAGVVTSKSKPYFIDIILGIAKDRGWYFTKSSGRIMLVGDKLTDMSYSDKEKNRLVVPILTNPQGGHDNIGEYLIMRRTRENVLLRAMSIKRASEPKEFRLFRQ